MKLVVWLTNFCGRVYNNSPITLINDYLSDHDYLMPVYYIDRRNTEKTSALSKLPRLSNQRLSYLENQVKSLQQSLINIGLDLFIVNDIQALTKQLNTLEHKYNQIALIYTKPDCYEENRWLNELLSNLSPTFRTICIGDTAATDLSDTTLTNYYFSSWYNSLVIKPSKYFINRDIKCKLPLVEECALTLDKLYYTEYKPQKYSIPCTEEEALIRFRDFVKDKLANYQRDRNYFYQDNTTKLEGVFNSGTLSRRMVFNILRDHGELHLSRQMVFYDHNLLLYRHFGAKRWFSKGGLKSEQKNKREVNLEKFYNFLENGCDNKLINYALNQLKTEGYLNNRLRMIFASYFCNKLNLDHRLGAELFEHYLLGFNPINNQAGWMWCAGLGNDSVPYPGRVFNINNQLYKYGKPA